MDKTLLSLLPFTNKLSILVSDALEDHIGFRFYYYKPKNFYQQIITLLCKFIALLGINLNVIEGTLSGGYKQGVMISIIYFMFSYLIPNIFFEDFYKLFSFIGVNDNKIYGLIFGVILIYILQFIINTCERYYEENKDDLFNFSPS